MSLAIDLFVCSVIVYLKVGLETPKKQKPKEKMSANLHFKKYKNKSTKVQKKYKNKVEMKKCKKTILLQYTGREEGQEDYPTPVASGV